MPRFVVHVRPSVADGPARAALARRYPEIDVVSMLRCSDGTEDWVCDAPNRTHLERWVAEQGVRVDRRGPWVEPLTTDDGPADGPLTDGSAR